MRRGMISGAFAIAALVLAAGCSLKSTDDGNGGAAPGLAGAWRGKVQFSDGPYASMKDMEFLYAFNAGGTMTESSNYDASPPVTPAYGVWRETSPGHFEAKYVFYNTKPPARLQDLPAGGWLRAGSGVLVETITLAADGQSYDARIAMDLTDENGKPAPEGTSHATVHATRIKF